VKGSEMVLASTQTNIKKQVRIFTPWSVLSLFFFFLENGFRNILILILYLISFFCSEMKKIETILMQCQISIACLNVKNGKD